MARRSCGSRRSRGWSRDGTGPRFLWPVVPRGNANWLTDDGNRSSGKPWDRPACPRGANGAPWDRRVSPCALLFSPDVLAEPLVVVFHHGALLLGLVDRVPETLVEDQLHRDL